MIEVIEPGLETSVQELPGRIGFWEQGIPPSGPLDSWSFRLANLLVGNDPESAALEIQFLGPTLKFKRAAIVSVTGCEIPVSVDGVDVPNWTSFAVEAGQIVKIGFAATGARGLFSCRGRYRD